MNSVKLPIASLIPGVIDVPGVVEGAL